MQYDDDSPKSSRPNLLTPAQQAEADRHRILSRLETGTAGKPAVRRKRSKQLWIGAGTLLVAITVLLGVWAKQYHQVDRQLAALSAATDGSTAPAAVEVPADHELSSAAPVAVIQQDFAVQAQDKKPGLSERFNHSQTSGSAASALHDANPPGSALETPPATTTAMLQPQHQVAPKEKPKARPNTKPDTVVKTLRVKQPRQEKSSPEEENDVALLAALVSYTQAGERHAATRKNPRLSLDQQLAQCEKLSKTKAIPCHQRVCHGRSKTGGCKVQR